MSESNSTNMICPKCGQFQEKADICKACGIIIAKVRGEQTITQTQTGDAASANIQPTAGTGHETPVSSGLTQKLILPMILIGVIMIGIGSAMLINKLSGGSLNQGTMRHLGWFFIPVFIVTGVGCIGQALEWKKQ